MAKTEPKSAEELCRIKGGTLMRRQAYILALITGLVETDASPSWVANYCVEVANKIIELTEQG